MAEAWWKWSQAVNTAAAGWWANNRGGDPVSFAVNFMLFPINGTSLLVITMADTSAPPILIRKKYFLYQVKFFHIWQILN